MSCCGLLQSLTSELENTPVLVNWASNVALKLERSMFNHLNEHTSNISVVVENAIARAVASNCSELGS